MSNDQPPPTLVEVKVEALRQRGFTDSGLQQFSTTVTDYGSELFRRAANLGQADKAPNMAVEVGHDHVRAAAHSIARSFGAPRRTGWSIAGQIGEYVATAVAGVGGGYLGQPKGIITFALAVSIAVILVVVRLTTSKGE